MLCDGFRGRRDAKFKVEFVAKYVPESTVSVETGRRKAGAEKSLLIPSSDPHARSGPATDSMEFPTTVGYRKIPT